MGQGDTAVGASVAGAQKDPEQIRRDIEQTREDLGETTAALAAKTDVKARAKEKLGREDGGPSAMVGQVTTTAKANPIPTAAITAFVGGFLFGRLTKRS